MAKDKMHKVVPETYPSFSEQKKIKVYPTFRLGDDDLPEIKTMEVGKKYTLVMEVVVKHKAQGNEWGNEDDKQIRSTLKIMKVGCEDMDKKAPKKPMSRADFEVEQSRRTRGGDGSRY